MPMLPGGWGTPAPTGDSTPISAEVTPVVVPLRVILVGGTLAVGVIVDLVVQIPELGE
jgi:hypothetical protein